MHTYVEILVGPPAYPGRWPERALGRRSHGGLLVQKSLFAGRHVLKRTPYVESGRRASWLARRYGMCLRSDIVEVTLSHDSRALLRINVHFNVVF